MTANCYKVNYTETRSLGAHGKQGPADFVCWAPEASDRWHMNFKWMIPFQGCSSYGAVGIWTTMIDFERKTKPCPHLNFQRSAFWGKCGCGVLSTFAFSTMHSYVFWTKRLVNSPLDSLMNQSLSKCLFSRNCSNQSSSKLSTSISEQKWSTNAWANITINAIRYPLFQSIPKWK